MQNLIDQINNIEFFVNTPISIEVNEELVKLFTTHDVAARMQSTEDECGFIHYKIVFKNKENN